MPPGTRVKSKIDSKELEFFGKCLLLIIGPTAYKRQTENISRCLVSLTARQSQKQNDYSFSPLRGRMSSQNVV